MNTPITIARYKKNWINLLTVLAAALAMAAIGGNLGTVAIWAVSLILVAFVLSEAVSYGKNGTFKSFEVK